MTIYGPLGEEDSKVADLYPQTMSDLELFRSWFSDFLTIERFAEHNGLTIEQAETAIALGRDEHNAIAAEVQ